MFELVKKVLKIILTIELKKIFFYLKKKLCMCENKECCMYQVSPVWVSYVQSCKILKRCEAIAKKSGNQTRNSSRIDCFEFWLLYNVCVDEIYITLFVQMLLSSLWLLFFQQYIVYIWEVCTYIYFVCITINYII